MTILSVEKPAVKLDTSKAPMLQTPFIEEEDGDLLYATRRAVEILAEPERATPELLAEMGADLAAMDSEATFMERDYAKLVIKRKKKIGEFARTQRLIIERDTIGQDFSTRPWSY